MNLLSVYEEVSGKKVNGEKIALIFSKAVMEATRQIIKGILGVREIQHYEKYLELPSLIGKGKKASFNDIKERVWRKLHGWEGKLLSQAGREVLIKSVIQAIPTYAMECFKLPLGLCNEIKVIRKFWWGQHGDKQKIHWQKWDDLTKSKVAGGMGFRDLALYNDSLLAKQAWRLLQDRSSLFYEVFKAHFFLNCTIMEAFDCRNGSYAWKSMLLGHEVINQGTCWRIGDGHSAKIWQHTWLPIKHPTNVSSPVLDCLEEVIVDFLIDAQSRTWNTSMIDGLFFQHEAELIKSKSLSRHSTKDALYWPWTQNGKHSCKFEYRFLKDEFDRVGDSKAQACEGSFSKSIWALRIPNKTRNYIWRACHNSIPTKDNLMRCHITDNVLCECCSSEVESPIHALWSYRELDMVWSSLGEWRFCLNTSFLNFKELLHWILKNHANPELFAMIVWGIWHQRS